MFDNVVNRVLFNYTLKGKLNCIIVFHLMQFLDISVFVNCKKDCDDMFSCSFRCINLFTSVKGSL